MYLRPYKRSDAETILSWCKDEETFRKWTADRYESYPITAEDMNYKYFDCNGDCEESDNFYPMTACDERGPVGHFILRYVGGKKDVLRIGFVILDDTKRGKGYGKQMVRLGIQYAFEIMGASKVTIGVFENNLPAFYCYKAAGFWKMEETQPQMCKFLGETWKIVEFAIDRERYFATKADKGFSCQMKRTQTPEGVRIYYRNEELLIRDLVQSDGLVFTEEENAQGWDTTVEKFEMRRAHQIAGQCISLVAEYQGHPAGYVNVYPDSKWGALGNQGYPEIIDFAVLEKYRRHGIGRALMDIAEQLAGEYADTVYLGVGMHNGYGSAQRIYVKRGYVPDGSGVWYQDKVCTPYDTIYTNDDDLVLYLAKRLR